MDDSRVLYSELLRSQALHRDNLVKTISPPHEGFTIVIKDLQIVETVDGNGWVHPKRRSQYISMFDNLLQRYTIKDAIININLSDHPVDGCFNFCRIHNNHQQFLLPNHRFTNDDIIENTQTFDDVVRFLRSRNVEYDSKISQFYTSCIPHVSKIGYFVFALNNPSIATGYVYGGSGHKYMNLHPSFVDVLKANGLAGESHRPFEEHGQYKYVVYNDGNTLSDRMRLLLCTDSIIIRKKSGYEEFYTHLLRPGINYIEYMDETELLGIFNFLENNPDVCSYIRKNNREFVDKYLKYNAILDYVANTIHALF
jgi:hypothetical protein